MAVIALYCRSHEQEWDIWPSAHESWFWQAYETTLFGKEADDMAARYRKLNTPRIIKWQ